ncbi:uncharacterized protein LOC123308044 [Coccinella septempunctata]|uniref:uncharacterized protein LOC123308044 n=1 Tax=Coccinella septempunctata TaxID=41139 RepID=UPI001D099A08|nr:uncharacterized protein LOC123308044 [Coccinella septempunctata]
MIFHFLCLLSIGLAAASPVVSDLTIDEDVLKQLKIRLKEATKISDEGDDIVITAIVNSYADKILRNIDQYMAIQKFDPMAMPDISEKFEKFFVSGEFTLNQGVMTDASTLHRDGACTVSYNKSSEILVVDIPLAFTDLKFKYSYRVKYMKIGPTGTADGQVTNLRMRVVLSADLNTFLMKLNKYDIVNAGKMSLKFHGNLVYDWLLNLMTSASTIAVKPIILTLVEVIVKGTLKSLITTINNLVQEILGPDGLFQLLI